MLKTELCPVAENLMKSEVIYETGMMFVLFI